VADVPSAGLGASGSPYSVYYSALEHPPEEMELVVSALGGVQASADETVRVVHQALTSVAGGRMLPSGSRGAGDDLLVSGFRSAGDELGRVFGTAGWFGGGGRMAGVLAALVAVLGMVGALRVHVGARLREMGIRAALGAGPTKLRRRIVGEALRIGATGTAMGLWGAMLVVGVFGPPGVEPFSAPVFVVVTAVFLAAALWAVLPAARLAGTADPRSVMEG